MELAIGLDVSAISGQAGGLTPAGAIVDEAGTVIVDEAGTAIVKES